MGVILLDTNWLPGCLAHLNQPYIKSTEKYVVIGEVTSKPYNGYEGEKRIYTALVPLDRVQAVLNHLGGIGYEVDSRGPRPTIEPGETFKSDFWVRGTDNEEHFEPLVVGWNYNNNTVMMPDNGLLMCYGLCPRILRDSEQIIWDDLSLPEYGIISVKPLLHYNFPSHSGCFVTIDKRYLEDYASLKNCAVVAVFYEERRCAIDDELEKYFNGTDDINISEPGRLVDIKRDICSDTNVAICQVWGCRQVIIPKSRPISDEQSCDLEWPDYPGSMTLDRARAQGVLDFVYIKDQILEQFEGKDVFYINPTSGSISYDGWWTLSWCHRVGRDYIAYEIKKIYEGCPSSIIQNVNCYAVSKDIAIEQQQTLGKANIGVRAEKLINVFENLGLALSNLCNSFDLPYDDMDIIGLSKETVDYNGWWTLDNLKPLGYRVAQDMTEQEFLSRCTEIYKLFEGIKEKSLRKFLHKAGMDIKEIKDFRSLKLLATIMQLCSIALDSGLNLITQHENIIMRWNKEGV